MEKQYKIAVAGTGYVGLSLAVLLAQNHSEAVSDWLIGFNFGLMMKIRN